MNKNAFIRDVIFWALLLFPMSLHAQSAYFNADAAYKYVSGALGGEHKAKKIESEVKRQLAEEARRARANQEAARLSETTSSATRDIIIDNQRKAEYLRSFFSVEDFMNDGIKPNESGTTESKRLNLRDKYFKSLESRDGGWHSEDLKHNDDALRAANDKVVRRDNSTDERVVSVVSFNDMLNLNEQSENSNNAEGIIANELVGSIISGMEKFSSAYISAKSSGYGVCIGIINRIKDYTELRNFFSNIAITGTESVKKSIINEDAKYADEFLSSSYGEIRLRAMKKLANP